MLAPGTHVMALHEEADHLTESLCANMKGVSIVSSVFCLAQAGFLLFELTPRKRVQSMFGVGASRFPAFEFISTYREGLWSMVFYFNLRPN